MCKQDIVNNPMSFWSAVGRLRSTDSRTTTMMVDGVKVEGGVEIAEAFAQYFKSVYDNSALDCDQLTGIALTVTDQELLQAFKKLKFKRSCGPDGIPSYC
ncbi:hypothetical protein J6590_001175 [Homalodisca vitripennis]|nr:hypothetical protein J6590_001175 [Homalodisca vitripennis]